jgi:hypothetical protein
MTDSPGISAPTKPRVRWPLSLIVGATLTAVVLATALLALAWTPYDVEAVDIGAKLTAPSVAHWMGTDHFGRDVLSMIMAGAQNSLVVAFVAVGIGVAIGTPLGLTAAARGGWIDELVMRGNDLIFAFPALLLAVMITAVMGPGAINAVIGSWKIMPMRSPRSAHISRSGLPTSCWPSNRMLPVTRAFSGSRPMSAITVIDLPQPDSPISPSVSPRSSVKLALRTASAGPRWVCSSTERSRTSSRAI